MQNSTMQISGLQHNLMRRFGMTEYIINLMWDNDAHVWIATSKDVPGLVLEHGSCDALIERVRMAIPELIELNSIDNDDISIEYHTQRRERLVV